MHIVCMYILTLFKYTSWIILLLTPKMYDKNGENILVTNRKLFDHFGLRNRFWRPAIDNLIKEIEG